MAKRTIDVCDICFEPPDGDVRDHILFYRPCDHAVCNLCTRKIYSKMPPPVDVHKCPKCGRGKDAYA